MKKFWWAVLGVLIVSTLVVALGKSKETGISTEAWRNSYPDSLRTRLPGVQMKCVGGKLDPICVGHRMSMAQGKYGNWVSFNGLEGDEQRGYTSGIAGWYIGGSACRFYYVTEDSVECRVPGLDGSPCGIIKEIACE